MATLIISLNNPTKMGSFLGIKSSTIIMIGMFFILLLNLTSISAQTDHMICANHAPATTTLQEVEHVSVTTKCEVYTVFMAKTFPLIEGTDDVLNPMEEDVFSNYNLQTSTPTNALFDLPMNSLEISTLKNSSKNQKNLLTQKFNS
jgi:hypothetical protein